MLKENAMHLRRFVQHAVAVWTGTLLVWTGMVGALVAADADIFVAPTAMTSGQATWLAQ